MGKTIAAIATALGEASIGVVRISGDGAVTVADRVFQSVSGKALTECTGYSALFGYIEADGEQALRASMLAKSGALSKKCSKIKDKLTFAAATVAAFSDFPDEEPEFSGID